MSGYAAMDFCVFSDLGILPNVSDQKLVCYSVVTSDLCQYVLNIIHNYNH